MLLFAVLSGCGTDEESPITPPAAPPPPFIEVAQTHGLNFTYHSGHEIEHYLPEITAGGVALFDMDKDDDLDVYMVQAGNLLDPSQEPAGNQLFRNRGDGSFDNVTANSGAEDRGYGAGVATGDYDNDGDLNIDVRLPTSSGGLPPNGPRN